MTCRGARTLIRTGVVAVLIGGSLPLGSVASASVQHGNDWGSFSSGNGRHNRNVFIINSHNFSHDVQHIRDINLGGNTLTPAAICKRPAGRCKIVQRVVVDP